jgi:hypothetical protein
VMKSTVSAAMHCIHDDSRRDAPPGGVRRVGGTDCRPARRFCFAQPVLRATENKPGSNSLRTGKITGNFLFFRAIFHVCFQSFLPYRSLYYNITRTVFCRSVPHDETASSQGGQRRAGALQIDLGVRPRSAHAIGRLAVEDLGAGTTGQRRLEDAMPEPPSSARNENRPGSNSLRTGKITGNFFIFSRGISCRFLSLSPCRS